MRTIKPDPKEGASPDQTRPDKRSPVPTRDSYQRCSQLLCSGTKRVFPLLRPLNAQQFPLWLLLAFCNYSIFCPQRGLESARWAEQGLPLTPESVTGFPALKTESESFKYNVCGLCCGVCRELIGLFVSGFVTPSNAGCSNENTCQWVGGNPFNGCLPCKQPERPWYDSQWSLFFNKSLLKFSSCTFFQFSIPQSSWCPQAHRFSILVRVVAPLGSDLLDLS